MPNSRRFASMTSSPKLVLLDLDDTLCEYSAARRARLRRAFLGGDNPTAHAHLDLDLDRLVADSIAREPHGSDHFQQLFADHGVDDPAISARAAAWFNANRLHGLECFPGVHRDLARLRDALPAGGKLGLVSNGPAAIQRGKLARFDLDPFFDLVLISGEVGIAKPDPRIFSLALAQAGMAATAPIMVGDSLDHDVAGAQSAGIATVWIKRNGEPLPAGQTVPNWAVASLTEFVDLYTGLELAGLAPRPLTA